MADNIKIRLDVDSGKAKEQVRDFEQFLKTRPYLAKKLKESGQEGVAGDKVNWFSALGSTNAAESARRDQQRFMSGGSARYGWRELGGGIARDIAHGGLQAAGPAGQAVSRAVGSGWGIGRSVGVGAGIGAGIGSLVASGVSMLVGAIADKVKEAGDNKIGYDTLKRQLGDVGVSFKALETSIENTGKSFGLIYGESSKLYSIFTKAGNVSGKDALTLSGEVGAGIGLSRAFGLDPEQGVGFLGQMRGVGMTRNEQDTRRMALLIGETIAKSDAFAKADEVMEAIGNYATAQTRQSLTQANAQGYAGMFSAMVSSGVPGLDPSGSAMLLGRVNAALAAGGAKGEASQFFTAKIADRLGLDPLQMQMFRENGAMATANQVFGKGSNFERITGGTKQFGAEGDKTLLALNIEQLHRDYKDPMERANAGAGQFGISMNGAAVLDTLKEKDMGKYAAMFEDGPPPDISGVANLARAVDGTADDRRHLRSEFLARDDLKQGDRAKLDAVDKNDDTALQKVLVELSKSYRQAETDGSVRRAQRAALDNIATDMANYIVPVQNMLGRWLADKGYKSPNQIKAEYYVKEKSEGLYAERDNLRSQLKRGEITQAQYDEKWNDIKDRAKAMRNNAAKIAKGEELDPAGNTRVNTGGASGSWEYEQPSLGTAPGGAGSGPATVGAVTPTVAAGGSGSIDELLKKAAREVGLPENTLIAIREQETGNDPAYIKDPAKYHYNLDASGRRIAGRSGKVSTAFGPFGILESTAKNPGYGVEPLKSKSLEDQIYFAGHYIEALAKNKGSLKSGLAAYGDTTVPYSAEVMAKIGNLGGGTPLPPGALKSSQAAQQVDVNGHANVNVTVVNPQGQQVAQPQSIRVRLAAANPDRRFDLNSR